MGNESSTAEIIKICSEYLKEISDYLYTQILEIARFFQTVFQLAIKFWNEKVPETFVITKKQYVILLVACLVLCFHRNSKTKKARQKQKQQINQEAKKFQRVSQAIPKGPKVLGQNWYPTGWIYNEKTKLWEPPDFLVAEAKDRWVWDPEKGIWIDLHKDTEEQ